MKLTSLDRLSFFDGMHPGETALTSNIKIPPFDLP
jgi:hypothetical protein